MSLLFHLLAGGRHHRAIPQSSLSLSLFIFRCNPRLQSPPPEGLSIVACKPACAKTVAQEGGGESSHREREFLNKLIVSFQKYRTDLRLQPKPPTTSSFFPLSNQHPSSPPTQTPNIASAHDVSAAFYTRTFKGSGGLSKEMQLYNDILQMHSNTGLRCTGAIDGESCPWLGAGKAG